MNIDFLVSFNDLKKKNEQAIREFDLKLSNQEIDQISYDEEIIKIKDNLQYFAKLNSKSASDYIKEKLNYDTSIYIEIDELNVDDKPIKTLAVKNNEEYQLMVEEINNLINTSDLNEIENEQINNCLEIISIFHEYALENAPKRKEFDKTLLEVDNKKKEKKEEKEKIKATFFQRFFPSIIFVIVLILFYLFYIFFY